MKLRLFSISVILILALISTFDKTSSINVQINGIVLDEQGSPLFGATVLEKNTRNSAVTDIDGKFSIEIHKVDAVLIAQYTGYNAVTIKLANQDINKPILIRMESPQIIEEIVVQQKIQSKPKKQNHSQGIEKEFSADMYEASSVTPSALHYDEEKPLEDGNYSEIQEQGFYDPRDQPLSTLSIDVDRASYSNVRRFLQQGSLPHPDAVRIEEMINYFNYQYDEPSSNSRTPFALQTTLTDCPWNADHQLLHVGMQAKKMDRKEIPPSNFVFLIDVSGSMSASNKLPLLKSAFKLLVNQLTEKDKIAIVVYAGAAGCVLESTPGSEKEKIWDALDRLNAGGSTAGAAGIQLAYQIAQKNLIKDGNNRIILATDGDFNVGTNGDEELVKLIEKERNNGVFLSIMGFGIGNYQDGKMQKIADAGNGNHSYIDNMQETKKVLMDEFAGTLFTLAKDVKIQIEFNPSIVSSYRMIGYENRVLAARDFNDDTKDAGELGAGHSVTILYEIIPVGSSSNYQVSIDPLKYQTEDNNARRNDKKNVGNELATIKSRYKQPNADVSTKETQVIENDLTPWKRASNDVKWAISVAEWGMQLRASKYLNGRSYSELISEMKSITQQDSDPYRNSCLDLVEIASAMTK